MAEVGSFIRALRESRGLSQAQLARRARTTQPALSRIERGEVSPSVATVENLLRAMGLALELEARPLPGAADDAELRRFRAGSPEERLAESFAAAEWATALHGRARR